MKLALLLLLASASPPPIEIAIRHPEGPLFGRQEISAEVRSDEPVVRVLFLVDGRPVGVCVPGETVPGETVPGETVPGETVPVETAAEGCRASPFSVEADFGEENRDHHVVVLAYGDSGATARAEIAVPALSVHEEIDLDLQQVYVTAADRRGRRVLDLTAGDFRILDEGRPQEIVTFEGGDVPFTAVIVLDGSQSMKGKKLETALAGARAFVGGMRPLDESRLLVVADRLLEASPFVSRGESLATALDGVAATGGTALYDYLYLALEALESRQGRRVVILLSDGCDAHSVLTLEELREVARYSRALVYWLRLPAGRSLPLTTWRSRDVLAANLEGLGALVRETGGRVVTVAATEDIGTAFGEVLDELREQYAIGYYPEPRMRDAGWRRVGVEVERRGLELRWRDAYFDR